jgi:hypothetical protein
MSAMETTTAAAVVTTNGAGRGRNWGRVRVTGVLIDGSGGGGIANNGSV